MDTVLCTDTRVAPVIDTVSAVSLVSMGALALGFAIDGGIEDQGALTTSSGVTLTAGALFAASSIYGYGAVSECVLAKDSAAIRRTVQRKHATRVQQGSAPGAQPGGCQHDMQCKGNRVCLEGTCMQAPPPSPPDDEEDAAQDEAPVPWWFHPEDSP